MTKTSYKRLEGVAETFSTIHPKVVFDFILNFFCDRPTKSERRDGRTDKRYDREMKSRTGTTVRPDD